MSKEKTGLGLGLSFGPAPLYYPFARVSTGGERQSYVSFVKRAGDGRRSRVDGPPLLPQRPERWLKHQEGAHGQKLITAQGLLLRTK
jgi:hypothetical protein